MFDWFTTYRCIWMVHAICVTAFDWFIQYMRLYLIGQSHIPLYLIGQSHIPLYLTFPRCSRAARIFMISQISSSVNMSTFIADLMLINSALSSLPSHVISPPCGKLYNISLKQRKMKYKSTIKLETSQSCLVFAQTLITIDKMLVCRTYWAGCKTVAYSTDNQTLGAWTSMVVILWPWHLLNLFTCLCSRLFT